MVYDPNALRRTAAGSAVLFPQPGWPDFNRFHVMRSLEFWLKREIPKHIGAPRWDHERGLRGYDKVWRPKLPLTLQAGRGREILLGAF
jgi:hypothetical protein